MKTSTYLFAVGLAGLMASLAFQAATAPARAEMESETLAMQGLGAQRHAELLICEARSGPALAACADAWAIKWK